ncbi:MAG: hypothetical protein JXR63_11680 [Spirochaetales bacterium]|nr:hypothetical protein [Spirochaetales bacterium]
MSDVQERVVKRYKCHAAEVVEKDVYKDDCLDRQDAVQKVKKLLVDCDGAFSVSINGAWGSGKSFFLTLLEQELKNEKVKVVKINAWETDFAGEPLYPLISSFQELLNFEKENEYLKKASNILKNIAFNAVSVASKGIIDKDVSSRQDGESGDFSLYKKTADYIRDFKKELKEVVITPHVILVDELDRCRPDYALKMLEILKHLFSEGNLKIVYAMDESQMHNVVRTVYGLDTNVDRYLKRFIDYSYSLPEKDLSKLAEKTCEVLRLSEHVDQGLLKAFCNIYRVNIRDFEKFMVKFKIKFEWCRKALSDIDLNFVFFYSFLFEFDNELYFKIYNAEISSDELDAFFEKIENGSPFSFDFILNHTISHIINERLGEEDFFLDSSISIDDGFNGFTYNRYRTFSKKQAFLTARFLERFHPFLAEDFVGWRL